MAKYIFRLLILLSAFFYTKCATAQVNVSTTNNALALAQSLVGAGVTVSNATLVGSYMNGSSGLFQANNSNLGIQKGVVLSSGMVSTIPSLPINTSTDNTCFNCSNPSLVQLAQQGTVSPVTIHDAISLEFDVFVTADTLKFNYVFASEEYPHWVCSSFNDVFGFFISGPGISGPYSGNSKNIALIPGTNTPVSINTINGGGTNCDSNSQYYNHNNAGANTVIFNGYTTVMTAVVVVQPCQTYRLRLSVGDAGDDALDSGVFIEAGSLTSTGLSIKAETVSGSAVPFAIEECNAGIFTFSRSAAATTPLTVNFTVGGTATEGVDYPVLGNSITIPAGHTSAVLNVLPINDNISEGTEKVVIYLHDACFGQIIDSAWLEIKDYTKPVVSNDKIICAGETTQLVAAGGLKYTWSPAASLSDPNIANPVAHPSVTTTYTVKIEIANCIAFDSVKVEIKMPPVISVSNDTIICAGGNAQLSASGANKYAWSPAIGLSDPNIADPVASPSSTTIYTVTAGDGCTITGTVAVTIQQINIWVNPDTAICIGNDLQLIASGGVAYHWSPAADLNDPNLAAPVATPSVATIYTVTVTDALGCTATEEVDVKVGVPPVIDLGADTTICWGEEMTLDAGVGAASYIWQNGLKSRYFTVAEEGKYMIRAADQYGCAAFDSIMIYTEDCEILTGIPNAFSPNGDGLNDVFKMYLLNANLSYVKIFNRWGQMVFESGDEHFMWDGTYNGSTASMGAYMWIIEYINSRGEKKMKKGNLTLLR